MTEKKHGNHCRQCSYKIFQQRVQKVRPKIQSFTKGANQGSQLTLRQVSQRGQSTSPGKSSLSTNFSSPHPCVHAALQAAIELAEACLICSWRDASALQPQHVDLQHQCKEQHRTSAWRECCGSVAAVRCLQRNLSQCSSTNEMSQQ